MIAVLCAHKRSHYFSIPGLDVYDQARDMRNFSGGMPVICHPPCAQWSRFRSFAKKNTETLALAHTCLAHLKREGGIFEHPAGSLVWDQLEWPEGGKLISVNQSWWGFPAVKQTYLYFYQCRPLAVPLNFDAITHVVARSFNDKTKRLKELPKGQRALTPLAFDQWLVDCIRATYSGSYNNHLQIL